MTNKSVVYYCTTQEQKSVTCSILCPIKAQHLMTRLNVWPTIFSPKKNVEFERFKFREEKQRQGETVDAFHLRLQQLAKTCDFKEKDAEIKSQIICGCLSSRLRRKALREEISLKELLNHARASELSEIQALSIEKSPQPNFVNS